MIVPLAQIFLSAGRMNESVHSALRKGAWRLASLGAWVAHTILYV